MSSIIGRFYLDMALSRARGFQELGLTKSLGWFLAGQKNVQSEIG